MSSRVPLELCEQIIDIVAAAHSQPVLNELAPHYQLRQRHLDLVACALTCRAWKHRSTYHIYSKVLLSRKSRLEQFCNIVCNDPERALAVRVLYLCSPARPYAPSESDTFSRWSHVMPMRLSRVLPNLEELFIMDLDWRNPHKSFFMFLAGFSTVRILQMDDVYFDSPRRLLQFLSFFPHLNTLKLNGIQYGGGIPSSFHAGGVRPKLQLHMDSVEILQIAEDWHVMEWLNRSVLSTNSICVQISKLLGSRISVFQKFLDRNTSLRKLSISFARPVLAYDILDDLHLSSNTLLQSLTVGLEPEGIPFLARFLATITSLRMKEISVILKPKYSKQVPSEDYGLRALDRVLAEPKFEKLGRFFLDLSETPVLEAYSTKYFSGLRARNTLAVKTQ